MSRISQALLALLVLGQAYPVLAVDGVIEISQAKALAGAINDSLVADAPGFPVTITKTGSYRLTGNLDVPAGIHGIVSIVANDVALDLNGYTIRCTGAGCGNGTAGIYAAAGTVQNTMVRNGTFRGFAAGVQLNNYSLVENVTAIANTIVGVSVGVASVVRGCVATANGTGVQTGGGSMIEHNLIDDNVSYGVCDIPGNAVYSALGRNVISSNGQSVCSASLVRDVGGNLCGSNASCP